MDICCNWGVAWLSVSAGLIFLWFFRTLRQFLNLLMRQDHPESIVEFTAQRFPVSPDGLRPFPPRSKITGCNKKEAIRSLKSGRAGCLQLGDLRDHWMSPLALLMEPMNPGQGYCRNFHTRITRRHRPKSSKKKVSFPSRQRPGNKKRQVNNDKKPLAKPSLLQPGAMGRNRVLYSHTTPTLCFSPSSVQLPRGSSRRHPFPQGWHQQNWAGAELPPSSVRSKATLWGRCQGWRSRVQLQAERLLSSCSKQLLFL